MWSKKRYSILMLAAIFFIIMLCEYFYFDLFSDNMFSVIHTADGREYLDATDIFFNSWEGHPTRTIGYPIFLKIIYLLGEGDFDHYIFFFIQLLLWFCTTTGTFFCIQIFKNNKTAFFLSSTLLFLPGTSIRCLQIMTEPFYAFLLVAMILFLIIGLKEKNPNYFIFSWLILVFSVLVRPTLFYACILIFPCVIYYFLKKKKYHILVIACISPFLLIGGQARLMNNLTGEYKLSYIADLTVYYYFSAYIVAANTTDNKNARDVKWGELRAQRENELGLPSYKFSAALLEKNDWKESSKEMKEIIKTELGEKPLISLAVFVRNFLQNSTGGNDNLVWINQEGSQLTKNIYLFTRLQCLIFTIVLLLSILLHIFSFRNWRANIWLARSFIILIVLNLILTDPISFAQGDRFRVVTFPITLILLAMTWRKNKALEN